MPSTSEKKPVHVTILSRSYRLLAAGDPGEVQELAADVDELMLSIAGKAPNADSTHIAVLACLQLADRLRTLQRDLGRLQERVDRKSSEFSGVLDHLIRTGGES